MSTAAGRRPSPARTVGSVGSLAVPTLLGFSIPVLGFVASLLVSPVVAARVRQRLWPRTSARAAVGCAALALAGLWLPALLALFSQGAASAGLATGWLLVPLCAPVQLSTLVLPALAATAASLVGSAVSALLHRPWPWVVSAWVAPWAYVLTTRSLPDGAFFC